MANGPRQNISKDHHGAQTPQNHCLRRLFHSIQNAAQEMFYTVQDVLHHNAAAYMSWLQYLPLQSLMATGRKVSPMLFLLILFIPFYSDSKLVFSKWCYSIVALIAKRLKATHNLFPQTSQKIMICQLVDRHYTCTCVHRNSCLMTSKFHTSLLCVFVCFCQ